MVKVCAECGKEFETNKSQKKYCCCECRAKAIKRQSKKYYEENPKVHKPKRKAKKDTLSEKIQTANRLGISYGQLQAELYKEKHNI